MLSDQYEEAWREWEPEGPVWAATLGDGLDDENVVGDAARIWACETSVIVDVVE